MSIIDNKSIKNKKKYLEKIDWDDLIRIYLLPNIDGNNLKNLFKKLYKFMLDNQVTKNYSFFFWRRLRFRAPPAQASHFQASKFQALHFQPQP